MHNGLHPNKKKRKKETLRQNDIKKVDEILNNFEWVRAGMEGWKVLLYIYKKKV